MLQVPDYGFERVIHAQLQAGGKKAFLFRPDKSARHTGFERAAGTGRPWKSLAAHAQKTNWMVVVLLGVSLSLAASWFAWKSEDARLRGEVEDHLHTHLVAVETEIRSNFAVIEGLGAFFQASDEVTAAEFRTYAQPVLGHHPTIRALEWIPRVPEGLRAAFEKRALHEKLSDHGFTERNSAGRLVAAGHRPEYYPVFFVEPRDGNESALLFDLASDATLTEELERARDSGRMVATARVALARGSDGQYGFWVCKPVYRNGVVPDSVEGRQRNLIGFVLGAMGADDIMSQAMAPLHAHDSRHLMRAYLFDLSAPAGERSIYPKDTDVVETSEVDHRYRVSRFVEVGGREWLLVASPESGFSGRQAFGLPGIVLVGGFMITALFSTHLRRTLSHGDQMTRAHRDIRESEARLHAFMRASPESMSLKDLNGRYIAVNKEWERRQGDPAADVVGRRTRDIFPAKKAELIEGLDSEVLSTGKIVSFEMTDIDQTGSELLEKLVKFPIRDHDGKVIGLGGIATDVTGLKRTREALRRSNRALRTLSATNRTLVHAESEDSLVAEICRLIVEIGEYPFAWVGFVEDSAEKDLVTVARFEAAGGGPGPVQLPNLHTLDSNCPAAVAARDNRIVVVRDGLDERDRATCLDFGEIHGFRSTLSLPLAEGTRPFGALMICAPEPECFDREEIELFRELAEDLAFGIQMLRARERQRGAEIEMRKLQRAVEQSPHIVIITDPEGTIEYVNPKFSEITGYSSEEAIGENPRLIKSEETVSVDYADLWATITSGKQWRGTFRNKRKDGTLFWGETAISPVRDEAGRITHFIGIQEDITERIGTEKRLRQSEKMESLGNLAGGIAHDFNNMLVPILTLSKMVMRDIDGADKQVRRLKTIVEAGERASELVGRILAFSRTAENEKETTDLAEIVTHSVDLLRATLPATIELQTRINAGVGSAVVDRAQLQTIILNLASNAAHALAGRNGQLEITLERVPVSAGHVGDGTSHRPEGLAKLSVRDNGPGIPKDVLPHVFEPFFTTKAVGEGTGLGLAMVHGIVAEHGGDISIESTCGEGTSITVFLPLDAAESPAVSVN